MRKVTIAAYDKQWPAMFEDESLLLKRTLGHVIAQIHHVGSTSVPGLAAKPTIDILLEVVSLNALDTLNAAMARAGYRARGENGIPNRRYFTKGGEQRSHQVHAFATGDRQIVRHLAFRDYLIGNQEAAERYTEVKRSAARASENDMHRYSTFKAGFIEYHLQLALADWARRASLPRENQD
ncbi:MAG TPA: GrpB family protein [Erwinia sp.]|uniref:GrpB family protein n=1 Tax=Erwinia citreus TaxID=558 RepID=UPI000E8A35E2|nr:GrpB family protein [Erwinia sp.]HBV38781.1 GrpB family protein [Erwinia sp.]